MLTGKNILITGATGFVGYHLAKKLAQNNAVYCVVKSDSNLGKLKKIPIIRYIAYNGKLESLSAGLAGIDFDLVYHLASLFIAEHKPENIDDLIDSNIKFPTQLLEVLTNNQSKVKLVNAGTSWQNYDDSAYNPVCLYASTKQSFEDIIKYYHETRELSSISLRLYDTYGPEDDRKKLFWLLKYLKDTMNSLDMSSGRQLLNLVHIDDIVNAFVYAGKILTSSQAINEVYGVYSDDEYTLQEVVAIYEKQNNCKLNINWGKREYRNREVMKPSYYYQRILGWEIRISLFNGIASLTK